MLIDELIPRVAEERLARFCDIFCESIAFTPDETREIAHAATGHGLGIKLHVDQLTNSGGALLAAELRAISADHLEYTDEKGAKALAASGTVATILPLASLYLKDRFADGRMLKAHGCDIAVATDFNPGSAPSFHLPLAMALACINCGITPNDALEAVTYNAAKALKLEKERGSLELGKYADISVIDAPDVVHWMYHFQANACTFHIKNGVNLKDL
jgi:imidazolonepropionase